MRQLKFRRLAALTLAALATVTPLSQAADVLDQVSSDSLLAVKVANLAATSKKISQLATDFGIAGFVPQLNDPLAALKQRLGIEKGLKEDGDLGFAFISPKASGVNENQSIVILVPVSNYAEFVGNFDNPKVEGDITEVDLPGPRRDSPRFIANWGGYAALSPAKELLAKPAATLKLATLPAREAGRQDFVLYTNFAKLGAEVEPELNKFVDNALEEVEKDSKELDPKYKPLVKVAINQFAGVARAFLRDTDGATIGLNINDKGMNFTVLSAFKPDSYLGKFTSEFKGADGPLTIGLPATKMLAYGGFAYGSDAHVKVVDDLISPILDELKKIEGAESVAKLADSFRAAIKANKGTAFGMPVPAQIGQEGLLQQVAIYHGGGPETKAAFNEGTDVLKKFIADLKVPEGQKKPEFTQTLNSKQIEGVTFDSLKFDIPTSPDDPAAAQAEQMMSLFYGAEGLTYNYGVLGKEDLIFTNGATDETIAKFIKSALAKEDNVSKLEHVKVVTEQLPKTRVGEYYFAIDEAVNVGIATAGQFGLPVQVQLPPELPPLGFTFGTEGPSFRIDAHIPTTTIQALISAGMQVFMQMRGGGPGGNL